MIYDTFLFYNELELLEIRLNVLWDVVDYFVVVESSLTHQKTSKPLFFEESKQRFNKYKEKIIHVVIDDDIEQYGGRSPWCYQRDCIARGLRQCSGDDRIILSDIDEIPTPEQIVVARELPQTALFRQQLYYYFVDCKSVELNALPWSVMFKYEEMTSPQKMRDLVTGVQASILGGDSTGGREDVILLNDAGWHFSYLGGVNSIIQKIEAFADAEYNLAEFKKRDHILRAIQEGKDIYGRPLTFEFVNGVEHLPLYLRENRSKYANLFRSALDGLSQ